jgi:hypothetical protein
MGLLVQKLCKHFGVASLRLALSCTDAYLAISVRVVPVELPLATRNRTRFRNL